MVSEKHNNDPRCNFRWLLSSIPLLYHLWNYSILILASPLSLSHFTVLIPTLSSTTTSAASGKWRGWVSWFPLFFLEQRQRRLNPQGGVLEAITLLDRGADATVDLEDQQRVDQVGFCIWSPISWFSSWFSFVFLAVNRSFSVIGWV